MYAKVHESKYGILVAACDKEVHGKRLKGKYGEFYVNPLFYGDKQISEKELIKLFGTCSSANLVGEKVVNIGIKIGLVDPKHVIRIQKIPHAIVVVIKV